MAKSALAKHALPVIQVLLVEDNPSDAFLVERLLEESKTASYKTLCVKTQADAMAALDTQEFQVCLLDLTLPGTNGFSAMIDIQEKAPDMPVLILTGINDTDLAKRAVSRGAQDFLMKDEMEDAGLTRAIDYAIERKRVEKELFQRANYDTLTGLANRESFISKVNGALARAERSTAEVAVLFIDLDQFKPINDAYGHDVGDEALKIVATRIKDTLRSYDTPARLGGDEFCVLLEGIKDPRDAANIAQKIIHSLTEPMPCHGHSFEIGASIGIAFCDKSSSAENLIQHADTAMYHAKKEGGKYRFYEASMHEETLARLSLEEDLRTAIVADELRLFYQPYVNPETNEVIGVEALLRWKHPQRGILMAQEFIHAAESARLMPDIIKWECEQMRRDIARLNVEELPPLAIAVNLSNTQLDAPNLIDWLTPIAQKDFLGDHTLVVEIPETAILPISGPRYMTIAKLHELGIGLHLDHFGCYSLPFTTLSSLPFSMLKIDISLIKKLSKEVSSDLLINAAIILAHHLGLKIGAVGVEAQWQAGMLRAQACDTMQGYFTARPMTVEQLVDWLQKPKNRWCY